MWRSSWQTITCSVLWLPKGSSTRACQPQWSMASQGEASPAEAAQTPYEPPCHHVLDSGACACLARTQGNKAWEAALTGNSLSDVPASPPLSCTAWDPCKPDGVPPVALQHAVQFRGRGGGDCAALHHSHGLPEAQHGCCGPGQGCGTCLQSRPTCSDCPQAKACICHRPTFSCQLSAVALTSETGPGGCSCTQSSMISCRA